MASKQKTRRSYRSLAEFDKQYFPQTPRLKTPAPERTGVAQLVSRIEKHIVADMGSTKQ